MNLFLLSPWSTTPLMLIAEPSTWDRLGETNETVLLVPSEESEVFYGHCIMVGSNIKFIRMDEPVEVSEEEKVYILSPQMPFVETTLNGRLISYEPY